MMKKLLVLTTTFFVLTSCFHNFDNLDKGLNNLESIDEAVRVFGPPHHQNKIKTQNGVKDYYYWYSDRKISGVTSTSQNFQGNIGGESFYGTSYGNSPTTYHYKANLKIEVVEGKVTNSWYDGNLGGLLPFLNAVEAHNLHLKYGSPQVIESNKLKVIEKDLDQVLKRDTHQ
jgi:hypothetical protein